MNIDWIEKNINYIVAIRYIKENTKLYHYKDQMVNAV
jgi:hypothetical protein